MLDHITFGVADFGRSVAFYDRAFEPLGFIRLVTVPVTQTNGVHLAGYGDEVPRFWIVEEDTTEGKLHIALKAKDRDGVDAFYNAAIEAGGRDCGAPGLRPHYHPTYYAAFVLDPDGHNIEAVTRVAQR